MQVPCLSLGGAKSKSAVLCLPQNYPLVAFIEGVYVEEKPVYSSSVIIIEPCPPVMILHYHRVLQLLRPAAMSAPHCNGVFPAWW
ncbi:unnamed protein product [Knipowitschia caucasica]|uniref:Uncharacterized protein n=1 Tax=Knipowitschia caucasica TaxID=637954 RepID=A0AAV2JX27_KNICA